MVHHIITRYSISILWCSIVKCGILSHIIFIFIKVNLIWFSINWYSTMGSYIVPIYSISFFYVLFLIIFFIINLLFICVIIFIIWDFFISLNCYGFFIIVVYLIYCWVVLINESICIFDEDVIYGYKLKVMSIVICSLSQSSFSLHSYLLVQSISSRTSFCTLFNVWDYFVYWYVWF